MHAIDYNLIVKEIIKTSTTISLTIIVPAENGIIFAASEKTHLP